MAGHGAGGRRASTSRARRAEVESNENDDLAAAPSSSNSALGPVLPFSLPPRSPLAAIADPGRNPRSAPATPKSLAGTPRACTVGPGVRDRTSSIGTSRRVFDLRDPAAAEVPLEVPHFELDEDPAFWKDRNVQVLIRIRPISTAESTAHGQRRCLVQDSSKTLSWIGHPETMFTFDHVACETISQEKLFKVVGLPMVENCMSGYNGCLFAYGQTGSGKTYTMMGELSKLDNELSKDSGLTPRIFEYLFARIKEEEERRREDKLKYICKCSFLEIYNEQITDLLEPSSTNLQIREDIMKGVYVENLMECYVSSVKDVMMLLLQGVANRKMAATNMNSESSRSHSVFTCVIESRWERDSMTHLRFGRLNLVDLAGSERQKSSGAEGERLKEAANINRSLSTLGLVIMTLVDVANGKNRHVPYRDSRLTFLLQDSLGGNSKTTIVANVSPSICSSSETLSTLKFAQRAKLIQNNAKVNEDASGDVMALQRKIEDLQDQLECIKRQQNVPGSPCFQLPKSGYDNESNTLCGVDDQSACDLDLLKQKVCHLEDVLLGSLRREKSAETEKRKLESEIKHLNRLVSLMESDTQRWRMLVKLRDEKIRRTNLLDDGQLSFDGYLMDENVAMFQEIQSLQEQINENSQLTQFALENKRLIEQVRTLEDFYKQGEREMLLTEISLLRNHFLHVLEQKYEKPPKNIEAQGDLTIKELNACRKELDACLENNVLLAREVNKLRCELKQYQKSSTDKVAPRVEESSLIPGISQDQAGWSRSYWDSIDVEKQFLDSGITTDITESLELIPPPEIYSENQESPPHLLPFDLERRDLKDYREVPEYVCVLSQSYSSTHSFSHNQLGKGIIMNGQMEDECIINFVHQDGISRVNGNTEKICMREQHDETSLYNQENEILCPSNQMLQEELAHVKDINKGLKEKLVTMAEESTKLSEIIVAKDVEIAYLSEEWEAAIVDLTSFLTDGCRSLDDAYQNIDNMISSFPYSNNSVSEHVEKAMKATVEKEKMIFRLQTELRGAQRMGKEVTEKLHILRGATLAITEPQLLDNDESQEAVRLVDLMHKKDGMIQELKGSVEQKDRIFAEVAQGHSCHELQLSDNVGTVSERPHNEEGSEVNQANKNYQSKLENVLHLVEDKSNKVLALFSNFEEAQETMEEAEIMLSSLLMANEELKLEKDNYRQEVELLVAEKTSLIDKLQDLEASNACTAQRYDKFHEQLNECVAGMTNLATVIKGTFHQMQRVTTTELFEFCSEIINFGQELRRWICESRSYFVGMVALLEKGNSSPEQIHLINLNSCVGVSQQVDSCSHQSDATNTEFCHGTGMAVDGMEKPSMHVVAIGSSAELENKSADSMSDMAVIKNMVFNIAERWDIFFRRVSCKENSETFISSGYDEQNFRNPLAVLEKLERELIFSVVPLQCKENTELNSRKQDSRNLLDDIQYLKDHLAHFMIPLFRFIEKSNIVREEIRNENQFFTVLNNVLNIMVFITDYVGSLVLSDKEGFQNVSLLSSIFHDIGNIEKKTLMLPDTCLQNGNCPPDYIMDYASLRREFDRKSNVAEGLSFDLKLLQESTSQAKDMKDKADEISNTLTRVQREPEMKTSAMETMLKRQKTLEEELVENGAALIILRSELENSQSLSSELFMENKDMRVKLEEETVMIKETEAMLEDKSKVIEELERQILLLNSSEEARLMSHIKELDNSLKVISTDKGNLEEEILKLTDKLEMALALAEENEAASIEARQAAEISKIYAEEKEEEVRILERSVEELESTITVLEEEVCNLKEEVKSYQIYKKSEAGQDQDILTVESISKYDDMERLCPGRCQLEKRLNAEISAHQDARRKIEDLVVEANCKDEEIRQYKEHIAELVLHSEAQSLLFQEKYQEMEHMISKQKFGLHESNTETDHTKTEKPSGRTRGSGSPFRCISSIVQQMNSEKNQEILAARQRIEELEELVCNKQKEIWLLTSRLGAVDTMTHDIIRELLGVKLDMTNYANLLDHKELEKLLVASQQQIEQSKTKDVELDMLKEQFGHLIQERDSLLDDMDQRKTDLLESQLLVEQLGQREQMLEAQNEMLKMEKDNLQQKIMEMEEKIESLVGPNQVVAELPLQMGGNHRSDGSEFSRRLAQSDMLLSHARHEHSRIHAAKSSRMHRGRHQ